jgi:hypothetical protein
MGYEGKASYSFAANDMTGKIWVGGKTQKIQVRDGGALSTVANNALVTPGTTLNGGVIDEATARAAEIGAKIAASGFELVGYYYDGKNVDSGIGTAINTIGLNGVTAAERDNNGGYVQATYVLPFKTKLGVSWGKNVIEKAGSDLRDAERKASIIGAYHPLTKHVNLVAEYNHLDIESADNTDGKAKTASLGAILFF